MNKAQIKETEEGIEFNSIELKNGNVYVYDIESFAQIYDDTGKLPIPMVMCNSTEVAKTCFGANLKRQVAKAGDIRTFLNTYTAVVVKNAAKREAKDTLKAAKAAKEAIVD
jgi:hypothetical protein